MVAAQHIDKIEKLIDLADRSWVDEQVGIHSRFRQENSPRDQWSHRRPETSPLIPLIYEYRIRKEHNQKFSLGYWFGEPVPILAQVAEQVFLFQYFWDNLPNDRGRVNLRRFLLRRPGRFSSFLHELMVATHYALQEDIQVVPAFFDPSSSEGEPDIWLHQEQGKIGIQCKSRSPLDALNLPFELFQLVAGLFIRMVEDSEQSFRLDIVAKQKLTGSDADEIGNRLRGMLDSNLYLPYPTKYEKYNLHVRRLNFLGQGISGGKILQLVHETRANNFVMGAGLHCSSTTGPCENVALVTVTGTKPLEFIPWIVQTAWEAAGSSPSNVPMILALHLLGSIDFFNTDGQNVLNDIQRKIGPMFSRYNHIQTVSVSSDYTVYPTSGSEASAAETVRVDYKNPSFVSPI